MRCRVEGKTVHLADDIIQIQLYLSALPSYFIIVGICIPEVYLAR